MNKSTLQELVMSTDYIVIQNHPYRVLDSLLTTSLFFL